MPLDSLRRPLTRGLCEGAGVRPDGGMAEGDAGAAGGVVDGEAVGFAVGHGAIC
jgi:hypothetical protein